MCCYNWRWKLCFQLDRSLTLHSANHLHPREKALGCNFAHFLPSAISQFSPFQSIKNLWIFLRGSNCENVHRTPTYALKTSIFLFLVRKNQSESSEILFACFSLGSNFRVTSAVLISGRNGSDFHYRPLFFWQNHSQSLIIARNRFKGLIQCFMINDFCWFLLFTLRENGRTRRRPRKSPPGNS